MDVIFKSCSFGKSAKSRTVTDVLDSPDYEVKKLENNMNQWLKQKHGANNFEKVSLHKYLLCY